MIRILASKDVGRLLARKAARFTQAEAVVRPILESVRTRKTPNGDVLIGHRSAQASHLGNISYMQKRRIDFDPLREEILPF